MGLISIKNTITKLFVLTSIVLLINFIFFKPILIINFTNAQISKESTENISKNIRY
jgi:hypothetical protein